MKIKPRKVLNISTEMAVQIHKLIAKPSSALNIVTPGKSPKLTMSARESNQCAEIRIGFERSSQQIRQKSKTKEIMMQKGNFYNFVH